MFTLNYHQTLDQDTRRINKPIRGNHRAGGSTQNQNTHAVHQRNESEMTSESRIQKRQMIEPEPTPSFNSKKHVSANANKPSSKGKEGALTTSNSYVRKRMSQNRAMISSHNGFVNDNQNESANLSRLMDMSNNSALNDSVLSGHRDASD